MNIPWWTEHQLSQKSHNMDQFIQHTIHELKGSPEKYEQAQGVMLEILLSQNKKLESIEEQTKRTNGRVTTLEKQIQPLEEHHLKGKWLRHAVAVCAGVLITGFTILAGLTELKDKVLAKYEPSEISEKTHALKGR